MVNFFGGLEVKNLVLELEPKVLVCLRFEILRFGKFEVWNFQVRSKPISYKSSHFYYCHSFNIFAIEMSKPFKRLLGRLSV